VSKQCAHSVGRVSQPPRPGGVVPLTRAGLEQHDLLYDVRRVREDSRGDDASKVVREEER